MTGLGDVLVVRILLDGDEAVYAGGDPIVAAGDTDGVMICEGGA